VDPQLKSILTSVLLSLATAATTWAVAKGIVPSSDQNVIANDLAGAAVALGGLAVAWWKSSQASPSGLVQSIGSTDPNKVAAAIDAAPPATKTTVVQAAVASKTIPTTQGAGK
jgi:hypothetical protein